MQLPQKHRLVFQASFSRGKPVHCRSSEDEELQARREGSIINPKDHQGEGPENSQFEGSGYSGKPKIIGTIAIANAALQ